MRSTAAIPTFPSLLQRFFCERLINDQNVSGRTVSAYRDTFRLLLHFMQERGKSAPSSLTIADLDADTVSSFLKYLEHGRGNSIRTRNARLAALRSFMKYASAFDPSSLATIQRVLAIPMKRFHRRVIGYLSREEIQALLDAPDSATWSGRRDRVLLRLLYNTGARVSELTSLNVGDLRLGSPTVVAIHGKGRKDRSVPLWHETGKALREWLKESERDVERPLFPGARGKRLSRSGVQHRLTLAVSTAGRICPALATKNVSPHTIRHTTAMHMLQSGVDLTVIALWLGHESPTTTHMYMEADVAMKERALATLASPRRREVPRYRPPDKLLQFLEAL